MEPDEMDLSREAAAKELEMKVKLPHCGCGGSGNRQAILVGQSFPYRVRCSGVQCGMSTPWVKLESVADLIWARAMNGLVDAASPARHTRPRNRRSTARTSGAEKRATAQKGAQPKTRSRK